MIGTSLLGLAGTDDDVDGIRKINHEFYSQYTFIESLAILNGGGNRPLITPKQDPELLQTLKTYI
jgi:hypothetical protein